jgi:ABC-type polar amino acid transport system ATPase subunit
MEIGMTGAGPRVLDVADVQLRRQARVILDGVSVSVARGEFVALMGPSGSGKTTVLRAVAGLEAFERGHIDVDGVALASGPSASWALAALRRKVGMVFQFHCLFEHLTAIQNICLAPVHVHRVAPADAEKHARELLTAFGVEHRADALPRQLSGGEAQRVAIARALAVDPPLLLMDEPTASLDPLRRTELGELLQRLVDDGRTLVVATHDEEFTRQFCTRVLRMANGVVA